jgi:hypothetical protein
MEPATPSEPTMAEPTGPDSLSIRQALDIAWREHQHVRDQTWKSVQMVTILAVGLVTVDIRLASTTATVVAGLLVMLLGYWGALITLHHREYQRQKFQEILNCERKLLLIPTIVPAGVRVPDRMRFWHAFSPYVSHTAAFLLRMHVALMIFGAIFIAFRLLPSLWMVR